MPDPLAADEELRLRAFHRQVDRLRKSAIGRQGRVQISTTTKFDFTTGEIATAFSGYDPDAFQAQLPILRQFMLNDDIGFYRTCNLIYQRCTRAELLAWVREGRKRWQENLAEVPEAMHQHLHQVTSSLEDALHKLFYGYGGLFHTDIRAADEEANVAVIEKLLLQKAFPKLCWCLNVIDSVIYWWLDEPTKTVPPAPVN